MVTKRYLRRYPHGELAAQLFGTVSEITDEQLEMDEYKGIEQGTRIGQSGLEEQYDKYLRGDRRLLARRRRRVRQPRRAAQDRRSRDPKQGQRLKLTIDFDLQKAGDAALAQAIDNSEYQTQRRRVVAMDPRDGAILGDGLQARLRRQRVRQADHAEDLRLPDVGRRPARRCSTA